MLILCNQELLLLPRKVEYLYYKRHEFNNSFDILCTSMYNFFVIFLNITGSTFVYGCLSIVEWLHNCIYYNHLIKHQCFFIHLYCIFKAIVKSVTNQCVPDRYFQQVFNGTGEIIQIVQIQIMACIQAEIFQNSHI